MCLTSWLRAVLGRRDTRSNKMPHHNPSRQPAYSRPSLEHLEERTLLDAALGIATGASNPVLNSAPIFNGFLIQANPNTTSMNSQANLAVTSAFLSQDQLSSQFRDFGVNSQGVHNQFFQTKADILFAAYGFGSGAMPNAPWMPAAYNLGLTNNQFNYASQSDLGY